MSTIPFEQLREEMQRRYPINATSWSQATDEVRDLARYAREVAGLDESWAIDFSALRSPGEWNAVGIAVMISYYRLANDEGKQCIISQFNLIHGSLL